MASGLLKVKEVKNAILYKNAANDEDEYILVKGVRLSYPHFGEPQDTEDDDGNPTGKAWGGKALLPKATHEEAKELIKELNSRILQRNKQAGKVPAVPPDRKFLRNGDEEGRPDEEAGCYTISFSERKRQPTVRDVHGNIMTSREEIDDKFYGGCWGNVMIRPWFFDGKAKGKNKTYPIRLSASVTAVQFVRDDDPFGAPRVDDEGADWGTGDGAASSGGDGLDDDDI